MVKIFIVNMFDDRGSLNIHVLSKTSHRAMNRDASGADGKRYGISIMLVYRPK